LDQTQAAIQEICDGFAGRPHPARAADANRPKCDGRHVATGDRQLGSDHQINAEHRQLKEPAMNNQTASVSPTTAASADAQGRPEEIDWEERR
jgi:hypothetical protein